MIGTVRPWMACALLLLCSANGVLKPFKRNLLAIYPTVAEAPPVLQEKRLQPLRAFLPERGILGFVQEDFLPNVERIREFVLTQYVLAPLILVKDEARPLVIANFKEDRLFQDWLKDNREKFVVLKDLGNGVALLKREIK